MKEDIQQPVDTSSTEFKEGVKAGLNPTEDTKNWQAGNDLGQALKEETGKKLPPSGSVEPGVPVFMKTSPEPKRGNLQDEKDESAE